MRRRKFPSLKSIVLAGGIGLFGSCTSVDYPTSEEFLGKELSLEREDYSTDREFIDMNLKVIGIKNSRYEIDKKELDLGCTSYFLTFDNLIFKSKNSLRALAYTIGEDTIYLPQLFEKDMGNLWEIIKYDMEKDTRKFLKTDLDREYFSLIKKDFPNCNLSKDEFIEYHSQLSNEDSILNKQLVDHERVHQNDSKTKRSSIQDEALAYANITKKSGYEFIDLAKIVASDDSIRNVKSKVDSTELALKQIKIFYDEKMKELGIQENDYTKLSRQQIRDIASDYLNENFKGVGL
jgi:intergrase/recombinase